MKSIITTGLVFATFTGFAQSSVSAHMISGSTAQYSNGSKNIVATVGEITVLGKSGNEYIGSGFYRSNGSISMVSVREISEETISVYPNPFFDRIIVEPSAPFELFDISGRSVYRSESRANLASLPAGAYILKSGNNRKQVIKTEN